MSDTASSTASAARKPRGKAAPRPQKPLEALYGDLRDFYVGTGMMLKPVMPLTAEVVVEQAEPCASAWVRAAEQSATIRRLLEGFSTASVWGQLVLAHMPIFVAVQVQIGRMPLNHPLAKPIEPSILREIHRLTGREMTIDQFLELQQYQAQQAAQANGPGVAQAAE